MKEIEVEVVNKSDNELPEYKTTNAAACDVRAFLDNPVQILPYSSAIIPTGLFIAIPEGYKVRFGGRSGLAFKHDVEVHRGIIDEDYREELKVKVYNQSSERVLINAADRICQMYIEEVIRIKWNKVLFLSEAKSNRKGGLGSTGTN